MRTIHLEFSVEAGASAIGARLAAAGVSILPGFEPVPVRGEGTRPDTLVVAVLVPSGVSNEQLRAIPGVLGISADAEIAPL